VTGAQVFTNRRTGLTGNYEHVVRRANFDKRDKLYKTLEGKHFTKAWPTDTLKNDESRFDQVKANSQLCHRQSKNGLSTHTSNAKPAHHVAIMYKPNRPHHSTLPRVSSFNSFCIIKYHNTASATCLATTTRDSWSSLPMVPMDSFDRKHERAVSVAAGWVSLSQACWAAGYFCDCKTF
jgi:hypothetical protein